MLAQYTQLILIEKLFLKELAKSKPEVQSHILKPRYFIDHAGRALGGKAMKLLSVQQI